ncbi:MAG: DPP IV N-terminal domain-containing protein [Bacteroidales bacterium]
MRKFCFYTITLSLFCNLSLQGQGIQLTLDDAVMGLYTRLAPESMAGFCWHPDSAAGFYLEKGSRIIKVIAGSKSRSAVLTLDELNMALRQYKTQTVGRIPAFRFTEAGNITFTSPGRVLTYSLAGRKILSELACDSLSDNHDYCAFANSFAFTRENNLFVKRADQNEIQITHDADRNMVNGQVVSRNEFGIEKEPSWSPTGAFLAFYRKDESQVTSYPIVDIETRIASVVNAKYPMAGMSSEHVSIGIYNFHTASTIYIGRDSTSENYLTPVSWSPDEKYIYIGVLNRGQDSLSLNKYDAVTGKLAGKLFSEISTRYVEPLNPLFFPGNRSDHFLWLSQRDGYTHLYLYTSSGKLVRQLTSGKWSITGITGIDPAGEYIYLSTTIRGALERQQIRVQISSGKTELITREPGTHQCSLSPNGKYLLDNFESTLVPRRISMLTSSGKKLDDLLIASNPMQNYALGACTIDSLLADDNKTQLYFRYITPPDFDPRKKYPVVIYVYGGPHAQLVTNGWLSDAPLWDYYMAQKGYIVFTLDNRGSANRGFEFESCIHRQLGRLEMEDQMAGVRWLNQQPWVDTSRIGVHGWSYGGFMTIGLMTSYPGVFKVGVAGGPVTDWKYYEVMYGERYMDRPQENPLGYAASSLLDKAGRLKGRLLIIHGAKDVTVVWQQSLAFIDACITAKKPVDYFVYPLHEHNVRGWDRVHLMWKVTDYFDTYLR